jgi:hypothetical protein
MSKGTAWKESPMRTTYESATVRLYHLGDGPEGGFAETLFYGPLSEAMVVLRSKVKIFKPVCSSRPTTT